MKVIILTEAGEGIGFGHFTRCLALTQAFEEKGILVELLVDGDDSFRTLYDAVKVRIVHWRQAGVLDGVLSGVNVVIIDSYLASVEFYQKVSAKVTLALYLDDYRRLDYPAGIIWNGAIGVENMDYSRKDNECLLGADYALVRKEFWEIKDKVIHDEIGRILVTVGGEDRQGMLIDLVKFLSTRYPRWEKRVIIPQTFDSVEDLKSVMDKRSFLVFYPDGRGMQEQMQEADIAVSAGGQTLYELARIGVPTVGICLFENQRTNLENWLKRGFIDFVVDRGPADMMDQIGQGIDRLGLYPERMRRSTVGRSFVDGQGARRVVAWICQRINAGASWH